MSLGKVNLHTHTHCSDGRLSPYELVALAARHGLHAVGITDHDTTSGVRAALDAGAALGVRVVPGVELSSSVGGREVHILAYGIDTEHPGLQELMAEARRRRVERAEAILKLLGGLSVSLRYEDVRAHARGEAVGRPHVAAALAASGAVGSIEEAFQQYLGEGAPAYVPKALHPAPVTMRAIHAAGGAAVLAHPSNWVSDEQIETLIAYGLDGIETVHPSHTPALTRHFQSIVDRYDLIETGGSDYHGYRPLDELNFSRYTVAPALLAHMPFCHW